MSTSNSANMTLADRLVQVMKDDKLGQLVTDDDLITLAKKAIERSLYEDFTVRTGSGYNDEHRTNLVKKAAKEIAEAQCKKIVEEFITDEVITAAIQKYMGEILPGLVTEFMYRSLRDIARQSYQKSSSELASVIIQSRIPADTGSVGHFRHQHSDDDSHAIKVPHPKDGEGGI